MICQEFAQIPVRVKLTAYRGSTSVRRELIPLVLIDGAGLGVVRALEIEDVQELATHVGVVDGKRDLHSSVQVSRHPVGGAEIELVGTIRVEKLLPPLAIALIPNSAPSEESPAPGSRGAFESLVRELAPRYGLDPELVIAMIAAESGFRSDAVSPRGATGLMQLMPRTARRFGVRNSYHPVQNLRGGMSYLRWLLSYFRGNVKLAIAAYNAGESAVERHGGVPHFAETRGYTMRVMREYRRATHPFDPGLTTASTVIARLRTGN